MAWPRGVERKYAPLTPATLEPPSRNQAASGVRTLLHIDMDAFFAEVETRDNPSLRGRPVAVGGGGGYRGVVTSANYVARQYGLKAGMPSGEARKLCPQAVFLPVNGRKYVFVSAQIMSALDQFSPDVRPLSVDEASLDITGCGRLFGGVLELGLKLKEMVRSRHNLPCTVGIGPNRLTAKMAANLGKPDGLLVFASTREAASAFAPLPVDKMVGIGSATAKALNQVGIFTLGQLAGTSDFILKSRFGILGPYLRQMAAGEWAGRMRQDDERGPVEKSIGHQRTFEANLTDPAELRSRLVGLAEMVARRVRKGGWRGQVLTLTVRYGDFHTFTHQTRLPESTDNEETIIDFSWRLLQECLGAGRDVRLLGLSLGALSPKLNQGGQLDLFEGSRLVRREALYHALDNLRERYGEKVIARAQGGRYSGFRRNDPRRDLVPLRGGAGKEVFIQAAVLSNFFYTERQM
ncbi:MAG: DNA polymerase IV [Calditrichota bacterium]